jgi:hypothetical protein
MMAADHRSSEMNASQAGLAAADSTARRKASRPRSPMMVEWRLESRHGAERFTTATTGGVRIAASRRDFKSGNAPHTPSAALISAVTCAAASHAFLAATGPATRQTNAATMKSKRVCMGTSFKKICGNVSHDYGRMMVKWMSFFNSSQRDVMGAADFLGVPSLLTNGWSSAICQSSTKRFIGRIVASLRKDFEAA